MNTSVIVLTKNAGERFPLLLQRLFSQKFDGDYEVFVIDSGSTDGTPKVCQGFPVKLVEIKPEEFHHGRTRNLGAELSRGDILVYITQDALPLNNEWLDRLVGAFNDSTVAMVVGRQIPWQTSKPPEKFFYVYNFPEHEIRVKLGASECYHGNVFISNVNSAIRREVWSQFRFSESVVVAEDKEFAGRILSAGWIIIYEPEAAVYHAHDFDVWSAFRKSLEFGTALRQGAGGLPKSRKPLVGRALEYFGSELKYLSGTGCLKWLPYCMIYETAKYVGLLLGKAGLAGRNRGRG